MLQLTAAVHPLLRPLVWEGAFTVEQGADEEAAAEVADRTLVAHAVARATLATERAPQPALAATGGPVPRRVQALLAPPTPFPRSPVAICAALTLVCCVSLAEAAHDTERLFENATHPSAATHRQPH